MKLTRRWMEENSSEMSDILSSMRQLKHSMELTREGVEDTTSETNKTPRERQRDGLVQRLRERNFVDMNAVRT